jgi:hypothetical protein
MNKLPVVALLTMLMLPALSLGQEVVDKKNPLGFRSDLGLNVSFGGQICLGNSGAAWLECKGNNRGWSMATSVAIAAVVRPLKYFSLGLDISNMALRPTEGTGFDRAYKRFWDLSIGGVFRAHVPVRIRRMLLDFSAGLKAAFVIGYLKANPDDNLQFFTGDDSSYYTHRHFGPEISPIINVDLFIIPRFGFGYEMRTLMTMYQQVCLDQGNSTICRGTQDDVTDKVKSPVKMFFGLHLVYYL